MYLIQLLNPLLTPDIEHRLEDTRLKPIQPGQSLSSGWVERTPEGCMIEFPDEGSAAILATYMVEERKLSKKDIKLEADARAKAELQKFIETGQSRYVDPATGAVNTKSIRQEVMDELLDKSIPKRTSITVEFLPEKIIAFHTNNALHLDSVLHALGIDDEIEWRLNVLDMPLIFNNILATARELILSISFNEEDGGSVSAKNVDVDAILRSCTPYKVKSITIHDGVSISHRGSLKLGDGVDYLEAINLIKGFQNKDEQQ